MRAAYIEETGTPDVIKVGDLPDRSRAMVRCSSKFTQPP